MRCVQEPALHRAQCDGEEVAVTGFQLARRACVVAAVAMCVAHIAYSQSIAEFPILTENAFPDYIASGPDGNLWFTESGAHGQIGTMTVAPGAAAGSASPSEQTAILKGLVTPNSQATTYGFEYGPTAAYGASTSSASAGGGASQVPVSASISGLTANTTYHFRVRATNASGTTYGPDGAFTTARPPAAVTGHWTGSRAS